MEVIETTVLLPTRALQLGQAQRRGQRGVTRPCLGHPWPSGRPLPHPLIRLLSHVPSPCGEERPSLGRTAHHTRGGSNETPCSGAGHHLTFILLYISHQEDQEHMYKKRLVSCGFFVYFLLNCPQNWHLHARTAEPVQVFLYFSSLCLLLKPS